MSVALQRPAQSIAQPAFGLDITSHSFSHRLAVLIDNTTFGSIDHFLLAGFPAFKMQPVTDIDRQFESNRNLGGDNHESFGQKRLYHYFIEKRSDNTAMIDVFVTAVYFISSNIAGCFMPIPEEAGFKSDSVSLPADEASRIYGNLFHVSRQTDNQPIKDPNTMTERPISRPMSYHMSDLEGYLFVLCRRNHPIAPLVSIYLTLAPPIIIRIASEVPS